LGNGVFVLEGCSIGVTRFIAFIALICLLTACASVQTIPVYVEELSVDGETIRRLGTYEGGGITAVYIIQNGEGGARAVIQAAEAQGFNDTIRILVLTNVQTGLTERVEVLEHNETEDYGGYVTEEWFLGRFVGKDAETSLRLVKMAVKSKEDIVAITGATYTSQAIVDSVNMCLINYRRIIEEVEL